MPAMSVITPKSAAIRTYYDKRQALAAQGAVSEMSVREAFKGLLEATAGAHGWTLVVEQRVETASRRIVPDGTLRDANTLPRGYWEAKDTADDLNAEIDKKFARGYPRSNIIFEDTRRAVLYQGGAHAGTYDLTDPAQTAALLNRFYEYREPNIVGFEAAVARFKDDTPGLARGLLALIADAHKTNRRFQTAFAAFLEVCKASLNPNIRREAVDEMLIQHLLTERLMRTVFDNADFTRRNVIAAEVEKVIDALTSKSFNRHDFLGQLNYLYEAIESAARDLRGFSERQTFINAVYERFFQGYAVKVADTHGIVYTPQPIVDFMCAAVEEVLHDEFGQSLADPGVCLIDPCTGTGNFIINLLGRIHRQNPAALAEVYQKRLFANEVMLLPYYVASLNIEHAYYDLTGEYLPFEGLCFVDTLDLAEGAQMRMAFMTEQNSARVQRQKAAPITVIIGNPPYNVGQLNENDNNKNRAYEVIDRRVSETYVRDSKATNRNAVFDAYVKFFRWASDRLQGRDGIVCYVSNNGFVDALAFDGMRKHLLQDFTTVYHLDLSGNARTAGERRRREGGNVFSDLIRVGVGITVAVRHARQETRTVQYHRVPDYWRSGDKLGYLSDMVREDGRQNALNTVPWRTLTPDARHTWIVPDNADSFAAFLPMGSKESKSARVGGGEAIFKLFSGGVKTNRDDVVYDFDREALTERVRQFIEDYNAEVDRYKRAGKPKDVDSFVNYGRIKWSRDLKLDLVRGHYATSDNAKLRRGMYRPFGKQWLFFDRILNEEVYVLPEIYPTPETERENRALVVPGVGNRMEFGSLVVDFIVPLDLAFEKVQCFPFYTYDPDGSNRRENITDWALAQFREHYGDDQISKWDIFYYVYALLHHPAYREKYAANLKRDLPRIPYAPDFHGFARAGRRLAALHLDYETVEPYPLDYAWKPGKPITWRVEKMKLTPDRAALVVNDSLTLRGIPAQAFDYRLGSRSALDWVIDQYQVKTDKRSGITSDPNRYSDDERYIAQIVGRVVRVSVETVGIVAGLPGL
ncbi:MAG: DEAD/DEAH box helicase [Anaerolineae bacterium]|nr:DEAD/DEAH box helicase [Anaerolineae bacterium]